VQLACAFRQGSGDAPKAEPETAKKKKSDAIK
jgi:hypothetical protein